MEKGNGLINGPNNVIQSMNRVKKIQLLIARSVRHKVNLITPLIIDSNCSISGITETWLTIDDSDITSKLTPGGFKVLLANKLTSHRCGGLSMLFSSELKRISIFTSYNSLHMKF